MNSPPRPEDLGVYPTTREFSPGDKVFGERFEFIRKVGRGGMGVVWQAYDHRLKEEVALKFLLDTVKFNPEALHDLKRETARSQKLAHPHIVRVYDLQEDENWAAISMEFIAGDNLSAIKSDRPSHCFEAGEIGPWIEQLVEALEYAHTKPKVIHRDLKPSNLMITKDGELKVADFGIARTLVDAGRGVSSTHGSSGTAAYMSPQQAQGAKASVSDDVYSLGATLYDLLSGKPPFYSGVTEHQLGQITPPTIAQRRLELGAGRDPVPEAWERTIAACLSIDPARRPASVREVGRLLFGNVTSFGPTGTARDNSPGSPMAPVSLPQLAPITENEPQKSVLPPTKRANENDRVQPPAPATRSRSMWIAILLVLAAILAAGWHLFGIHPQKSSAAAPSPQRVSSTVVPSAPVKPDELAAPGPQPSQAPASATTETPPAVAKDQGFKAGDYVCVSGGTGNLSVTGPFPADDNRETWVYTGMVNGTWTTGPVAGHPQLSALPKDATLPKDWTFGLSTQGSIIAVRQMGDKLIIMEPRRTMDQWNDIEYVTQGAMQRIFQKKPSPPEQ